MKTQVPVLFLVFNRPETTRKAFQCIKEARPSRLYIAADGPRQNIPGEKEKCNEVRSIATNVDWKCEVMTLFREDNLGCKLAVSNAIDWFFSQVEQGIILEDDCLPNNSFFIFCEELLTKYAREERVMTISGNNFQPVRRTNNSYYFSKYMHCWGWASWKRAWRHFDLDMQSWNSKKEKEKILSFYFDNKKTINYWSKIFERVKRGDIDSWAYIWTFSIWSAKGINILPEVNLVSNIGFGSNATHTKNRSSDKSNLEKFELDLPLNHPDQCKILSRADNYTQRNHFQSPLYKNIISKIKRVLVR